MKRRSMGRVEVTVGVTDEEVVFWLHCWVRRLGS